MKDSIAVSKELTRLAYLVSQPVVGEPIEINDSATVAKLRRSAMGLLIDLDFSTFDPKGRARRDDFYMVKMAGHHPWVGRFKNIRNGSTFHLGLLFPHMPLGDIEQLLLIEHTHHSKIVRPLRDLLDGWKERKISVTIETMDENFVLFKDLIFSENDIIGEESYIYKALCVWKTYLTLARSPSSCKNLAINHSDLLSSYDEFLTFIDSNNITFVTWWSELLEHFCTFWTGFLNQFERQVEAEMAKKGKGVVAASEGTTTRSLSDRVREVMVRLPEEAHPLILNNLNLYEAEALRASGAGLSDGNIKRQAWLTTVAALPVNESVNYNEVPLYDAISSFEKSHYGMKDVKRALAEMLALKLHGINHSEVVCLVGPPGTGKTTIARSLANALKVPMRAIALGGVHDETTIRGISSFYSGSSNGRIVDAFKSAKVNNPIILLDEIDKMSMGRGSPASALLELLDPEQNNRFVDQYLGFPIDLSAVFWITTANDVGGIPYELRNRMHMIEVPGYTRDEQLLILADYLIAKYKKSWSITVDLDSTAHELFVSKSTSGVRNMEHDLQRVLKSYLLDKELATCSFSKGEGADFISREYVATILNRHEVAKSPIGFGRQTL